MTQYYTYIHSRASDGKVFYVGKGKDRRAWAKNKRSKQWCRVVAKHGLLVDVVARWETEDEAFAHERLLIQTFRDMGVELANHTDGGDGTSGWRHAPETIEKIKASNKGKKRSPEAIANNRRAREQWLSVGMKELWTPERRAAASAAFSGANHPNYGNKYSEETRRLLSKSHLGQRHKVLMKPVLCVETGQVFDSGAAASRWVKSMGNEKACSGYISAAAAGKFGTAYGYHWRSA